MKKNAVTFSIFIAVIISVFLAFSIFGILYFYWGDVSAVKDSFSTVAGFFGGFATLGAAVVAGYLFNGWKITEDHKTKNMHINNAVNTFLGLQNILKTKTTQAPHILAILGSPVIEFSNQIQIITNINEFQIDILYSLRALKVHIQLFAIVSGKLALYNEFEKVIDEIESEIQTKYEKLCSSIPSSQSDEILNYFNDYLKYTTGKLVIELHSKIIIKLSKKTKALN